MKTSPLIAIAAAVLCAPAAYAKAPQRDAGATPADAATPGGDAGTTPGTPLSIAAIGATDDNTLPAHRHGVRIEVGNGRAPVLLYAIQQHGKDNRGLGLFRSDDDGASWRYYAPIQNDYTHIDRADLVKVGNDVAMVYAYEAYSDTLSDRHDVYFQWWRYQPASNEWLPDARVKIFDASSSQQYYRAELARDSLGRIWVQAFLEESGKPHRARIAVSTDGGQTFAIKTDLDTTLPKRGGGRLLSLGAKLLLVYDMHDSGTGAYFRLRNDADALDTWGPKTLGFSEGIYHGAACSAVADGLGGMHLVYKDEGDVLWYRYFNGASFGARTKIQDAGDWTVQPAITLHGRELVVFYLQAVTLDTVLYLHVRTLQNGVLGPDQLLEGTSRYRAYPNALDVLPETHQKVFIWFCMGDSVHTSGYLTQDVYLSTLSGGGGGGGTDAGTPGPDASLAGPDASLAGPDAGVAGPDAGADAATAGPDAAVAGPDAGTAGPDAGATPGAERAVFEDHFPHNLPESPGSGWEQALGMTKTDGTRLRVRRTADTTTLTRAAFLDGRVDAFVWPYAHTGGVVLRAQDGATRYDAVFLANGDVQLRRVLGGAVTVLAGGHPSLSTTDRTRMTLSASGTGPVQLRLYVNGALFLSALDGAPGALAGAGQAGVYGDYAGLGWDDFYAYTVDPSTAADELFHDLFDRTNASLGGAWTVPTGDFDANGTALAHGASLALATLTCGDCLAEAVTTEPKTETAAVVRASNDGATRYEAALTATSRIQLRRVKAGVVTVLAEGPSGQSSSYLASPLTIGVSASGSGPVALTAWVNGFVMLTATDASTAAITGAGHPGVRAGSDGDSFDDFRVWPKAP